MFSKPDSLYNLLKMFERTTWNLCELETRIMELETTNKEKDKFSYS